MAFPESVNSALRGEDRVWRAVSDLLQQGLREHFKHLELDFSDGEPARLPRSYFPVEQPERTVALNKSVTVVGSSTEELAQRLLRHLAEGAGFSTGVRHLVLGPMEIHTSKVEPGLMTVRLRWGCL